MTDGRAMALGLEDEGIGGERRFIDQTADEVRSWFGDDAAERRRMIDEHHIDPWKPGPYKDVGPRGWRRLDDRIRDDVVERLTVDGMVDARDVVHNRLRVRAGELERPGGAERAA